MSANDIACERGERVRGEVRDHASPAAFRPAVDDQKLPLAPGSHPRSRSIAQHRVRRAQLKKRPVEGEEAGVEEIRLQLAPVEPRHGPGGLGLRVGDAVSQVLLREGLEGGELAPPTLRDLGAEASFVIGEVEKRRSRPPFLAHEKERRRGERQEDEDRRSKGVVAARCRYPVPARAVAYLIVVLDAVHERGGLQPVRWRFRAVLPSAGRCLRSSTTLARSFARCPPSALPLYAA